MQPYDEWGFEFLRRLTHVASDLGIYQYAICIFHIETTY